MNNKVTSKMDDFLNRESGTIPVNTPLGWRDPDKLLKLEPKDPSKVNKDQGLRFNKGKIRYDLLEPFAIEQLAKVFTVGSLKYEDNNWLRGMSWSKMIASLKRHLAAFEKGEDFDPETDMYHAAQVAWNALAIVSYYKHYPQGDDRYKRPIPRVGYDLDDVIVSWIEPWCEKFNLPIPTNWNFQPNIIEEFDRLKQEEELDKFYLSLPPKENASAMVIDPICYISHRPVEKDVSEKWLEMNGFPLKPVFHVKNREDKVKIALEQQLDIFVDDNIDTFRAMNEAGICCYLMDTKHNQKYSVGYRRIKSLKELL